MSVRIEKVDLPGIGTRHDVVTSTGRRLGVISHRSGDRELALFDPRDPDSCSDSIHLSDDEAVALSEVLGTSLVLGQFANLGDKSTGLFTEQIILSASSPFVSVPVLSKTKQSDLAIFSSASLLIKAIPYCINVAAADENAVGVASDRAHGQLTTSTVMVIANH